MSDCFKKNDLIIPGTRQDARLSKALEPRYVLPDERKVADLLVFISKYAKLIRYYRAFDGQTSYKSDGDWQPLIVSDEAFNYAGISIVDFTLPNITFYKYLDRYENEDTQPKRFNAYRVWWDVIFSIYRDINAFYTAIPSNFPLQREIATEIQSHLALDMMNAAGRYLNASDLVTSIQVPVPPPVKPFVLYQPTPSTDDDYPFGYSRNILEGTAFEKLWIHESFIQSNADWGAYLTTLNGLNIEAAFNPAKGFTENFFGDSSMTDDFDRIDYSTLQLKQLFRRAFEAYGRIIVRADEFLQNSLTNNSAHYAHHGLMLAFLKLFGLAQDDMNELTRKHLEYYYDRVLQLKPAPPTPDGVHVILEPAKNTVSHLIKKDTVLNAGKDDIGKLLLYGTTDELVINQAAIAELKTVYLQPEYIGCDKKSKEVFASTSANSEDGNGAPFTTEDLSWKVFGDERSKKETDGILVNSCQLGFYIASPLLHLTEGNRVIALTFHSDLTGLAQVSTLGASDWTSLFRISTTGVKGWDQLIPENSTVSFNAGSFTLTITLLNQYTPVVGYKEQLHKDSLATIYPAFKFVLDQSTPEAYAKLENIVISSVDITVTVTDLSNLSLQNELGTLDATKPVQIFGPNPKIGSFFLVGHPEIEHKKLTSYDLKLEWQNFSSTIKADQYDYFYWDGSTKITTSYISLTGNSDFKAKIQLLRNKAWQPTSPGDTSFLTTATTTLSPAVSDSEALLLPPDYSVRILPYTPETQNGFVRIQLSAPSQAFGHSKWAKIFAEQTVRFTANATNNSIPNPPYTPVLQSVKLNYTASQTLHFAAKDADKGQYFHLLPFGNKEILTGLYLLPRFDMEVKEDNGGITNNILLESALYIGISKVQINQNISILLQLNEGSEDISIDHSGVDWNYLSKEGWKHVDKHLLADSTLELIRSGIVTIQVPVDYETKATEVTAGLFWIRAGITKGSSGFPKGVGVYSNAILSGFKDSNNDPEHLSKALPPNTISKLFDADGNVKKVLQPYASFGGKKQEEGKGYYTRVSERLRHKRRGITIWDYEHIVLQQFPEVYLVKCLSHTGFEADCADDTGDCAPKLQVYKENLPGKVMLVPVPFVTNLKAGNKFQPTFSTSMLEEIKNYIHGYDSGISCNKYYKALHCQLAKLFVNNPAYETISVTCKIKVKTCLDALYYKAKLVEDLYGFLSPWLVGGDSKIRFGGSLHASVVVYFIEQLPYIDYLEDLTFEHRDPNNLLLNTIDPKLAVTTTSRSILTSAEIHHIQLIP
jgi:hypothetical protein